MKMVGARSLSPSTPPISLVIIAIIDFAKHDQSGRAPLARQGVISMMYAWRDWAMTRASVAR